MSTPPAPDVTGLLLSWREGQPDALDRLLPLVYAKLHRLAHARLRAESPGSGMLQTTALVHEAFLRLVDGERVEWQSRAHFYALCARVMRRILVDRARARMTGKRGARARAIPFGDWVGAVPAQDEQLLALEQVLERLAQSAPRQAQVVEMRFFGGLTLEETAAALGTSSQTVTRDWRVAKLWLAHELGSP